MAIKSKLVIKAKVAAVVAESQIAINAGALKGVQDGDIVVLHRRVDVKDPETGEDLGTVSFPRLRLKVNHVQDKMAVAMVIDRESGGEDHPSRVRKLLGVTDNPFDEDNRTIFVDIGETATVRREIEDPLPF